MAYVPIEQRPPAERREFLTFYAGVNEREAEAREAGGDAAFAATLRGWAAKARRQAEAIDLRPAQGDLFGGT